MIFKLLLFLFFCFSISAHDGRWILEQIKEDLSGIRNQSVHVKELQNLFDELNSQGEQVLYCSIYKGKIRWKKGKNIDFIRNPLIFRYFKDLNEKYPLPDMEWILRTDDGAMGSSLLPIFAFSRTNSSQNALLFPDFEMFYELIDTKESWQLKCQKYSTAHPWTEKKDLGFFRGSSTGIFNPDLEDFGNDRVRVMMFSAQFPELLDATLSGVFQSPILSLMKALNKPVHHANIDTHFQYKYLLDVDGNASTYSRCRWILLSNSVLVKVMSFYSQWYYKALQPGVHYVPVKQDLSDLYEALMFLKQNDRIAKEIAEKGKELGEEIFSKEVVDAYVVNLLQQYAQKLKPFKRKKGV